MLLSAFLRKSCTFQFLLKLDILNLVEDFLSLPAVQVWNFICRQIDTRAKSLGLTDLTYLYMYFFHILSIKVLESAGHLIYLKL